MGLFTDDAEALARAACLFPADRNRRIVLADELQAAGLDDVAEWLRGPRGEELTRGVVATCDRLKREPDALAFVCLVRFHFPILDEEAAKKKDARLDWLRALAQPVSAEEIIRTLRRK